MEWFYVVLAGLGLVVILAIIRHTLKVSFSSLAKEQEQGLQRIEKKQKGINQALNRFASAMTEYAKHLESHTEAIQNLAKASEELKGAAQEQNKFLERLTEFLGEVKEKEGG